jgi:hypothetical protein
MCLLFVSSLHVVFLLTEGRGRHFRVPKLNSFLYSVPFPLRIFVRLFDTAKIFNFRYDDVTIVIVLCCSVHFCKCLVYSTFFIYQPPDSSHISPSIFALTLFTFSLSCVYIAVRAVATIHVSIERVRFSPVASFLLLL